jgi:ribosomal subunit interface protein
MKLNITGQNVEIGSALHSHVETALEESVHKYFERAVSADVVFKKVRHLFSATIIVNEGTGTHVIIKASGESEDAYAAFNLSLERIGKQLRRYKRKLKNHHKLSARELETALTGTKYVISQQEEEEKTQDSDSESAPLIIAEKAAHIERLSVSDAVMRMDLADLPALLFINEKNGHINVVYRRADGNISWIDSEVKQSA